MNLYEWISVTYWACGSKIWFYVVDCKYIIFLWFNLRLIEYCCIISGISVWEKSTQILTVNLDAIFSILSPSEKDLFWVTVQCSKSANRHHRITCGALRCHYTVYWIDKMIYSCFYLISSIMCWVTQNYSHLLCYYISLLYFYMTFSRTGRCTYCPLQRRSCRNTE